MIMCTKFVADWNIFSYRSGSTFVFVTDTQTHGLTDSQTHGLTDSRPHGLTDSRGGVFGRWKYMRARFQRLLLFQKVIMIGIATGANSLIGNFLIIRGVTAGGDGGTRRPLILTRGCPTPLNQGSHKKIKSLF